MGNHSRAMTFLILQTMIYFSMFMQISVAQQVTNQSKTDCNLYRGKWVLDDTLPLYQSSGCPFIDAQYNCDARPDKLYLKYTWKPDSCDLQRFDGNAFLTKWKGKKIMFVGDSLGRNQWQSLACMVHASIPNANATQYNNGNLASVTFPEYELTLSLYRTPYLVDIVQENNARVLKLDSIKQGDAWLGMDMLIFDTWHWWTHKGAASQGWDLVQSGTNLSKTMDPFEAFPKGLATWAKWVDTNVDMTKTIVVYQGISPTHYKLVYTQIKNQLEFFLSFFNSGNYNLLLNPHMNSGTEWNSKAIPSNCQGEKQPLQGSTYPAGLPREVDLVIPVLSGMKTKVYLLDITTLSQLRPDAHPSVFSGAKNDCSHWCLPGLPDTWNQLLHAAFL